MSLISPDNNMAIMAGLFCISGAAFMLATTGTVAGVTIAAGADSFAMIEVAPLLIVLVLILLSVHLAITLGLGTLVFKYWGAIL